MSDILLSIQHIRAFTEGIHTFQQYKKNFLVKGAVERHLAIIGEAVNKLLKESSANQLAVATKVISLRNRLVHSYDNIDDRIIWMIVQNHLGPLHAEVLKKLESE